MHYLNGTRNVCICFGRKRAYVEDYTDADYAGDLDKRRYTSGYVFMFTGGAVSSYMACSSSKDLAIIIEMPTLNCNSQSVIMLAEYLVFHAKTKHTDVRYHFIRDMLEDKLMELVKVQIGDNPTNLMIKGLPLELFAHNRALMWVLDR
ncbi:hypothetical protein L7F22_061611 [Adiantum nelumboides]|nr:hypothetical protein [Adiantum nelumboides]